MESSPVFPSSTVVTDGVQAATSDLSVLYVPMVPTPVPGPLPEKAVDVLDMFDDLEVVTDGTKIQMDGVEMMEFSEWVVSSPFIKDDSLEGPKYEAVQASEDKEGRRILRIDSLFHHLYR